MTGVNETLDVAKGISDYGIMVIICAVFLVLSAALMVACFRWFKTVIGDIISTHSEKLERLEQLEEKNSESLSAIAEGLIPETQLRIRNLSGAFFDLATEKVCRLIKRIREENHIDDREATGKKVRTLVRNMYEDRNSKLDSFRYRGRKLSEYCNPEWVEWVAKVVEAELYHKDGANNGRAYTNVKAVYDNIKLDFYHKMTN